MSLIDLTGKRFGKLLVLNRCGSDKEGKPMWECLCDCGNTSIVRGYCLRRKVKPTRSCGCLIAETASNTMKNKIKHGQSRRNQHTSLYRQWISLKGRCCNEEHDSFRNYGARDITVCDAWINDFEAFAEYMGNPPDKYATVDRVDNDLGYQPGNVRWATRKEQANNRRDNVNVTHKGETMTLTQWAEKLGVKPVTFFARRRLGWPCEKILTTPVKKIKGNNNEHPDDQHNTT